MKKVLSVVLSVLIAVLAIVPVLSGVDFLSFKADASTIVNNPKTNLDGYSFD